MGRLMDEMEMEGKEDEEVEGLMDGNEGEDG